MKIVVEYVCISCGLCAEICPELFAVQPGLTAIVIDQPQSDSAQKCADQTAAACPVSAIQIQD